MTHIARSSYANPGNRLLMTAAVICAQLSLSGCGIPQLRCAQQGPALPDTFHHATNWAHETIGWPRHDSDSNTDDRDGDLKRQDGDATTANKIPGDIQLVSFDDSGTSNDEVPYLDFDAAVSGVDPEQANMESAILGSGAPTLIVDPTISAWSESGSDFSSVCWEASSQLMWYEYFDDPHLVELIGQALTGNQELKILSEEIWIASNEVEARKGEYLPFFNLRAGAGVDKASRFTRAGAVEEALEVAPGKSFPEPLPDFLVAADVSWEIDIWRKLRNAKDAAALRYLGTRDGQNYVVTRLVAEVAESYYELLALDNRLMTLDQTIKIQQQSLKVAEAKKEAARGTELAVQRFQAEVRKNQSEKLIIQQEVVEVENRINFLLGRYPQPVERASLDYIDLNLRALNVGIPSQLLQNRSDIQQAEREMAAAGLDVEVARARFYPSLDLTAGIGYQAFNARYLFITPEALIYNVVGELVMPVINRKAIKAAYRSANARQIQTIYEYQRTILNAYTEVVNQMTKVENYGQSIEIKRQQLAALEASVDSASKLFQNARAEYVEVLLAQREMMEARMILIETKQQQLAAIVNTYQALGGGAGSGFGSGVLANCP